MFLKLRPILFLFLPLVVLMSSCLKDDLEDLEKQLQELETALGSNEPIVFNLTTTDNDAASFVKNSTFLLKESDYDNTFSDYGNGEYYINVDRALNLGFDDYVRVRFNYDVNTKTVSYPNLRVQFDGPEGYYYSNIYDDETGVTFTVKVNSFNATTGQISFTANIQTDETASDNWFSGKPMTIVVNFNGTLANYPD